MKSYTINGSVNIHPLTNYITKLLLLSSPNEEASRRKYKSVHHRLYLASVFATPRIGRPRTVVVTTHRPFRRRRTFVISYKIVRRTHGVYNDDNCLDSEWGLEALPLCQAAAHQVGKWFPQAWYRNPVSWSQTLKDWRGKPSDSLIFVLSRRKQHLLQHLERTEIIYPVNLSSEKWNFLIDESEIILTEVVNRMVSEKKAINYRFIYISRRLGYLHHLGVRRLYDIPRRLITSPKIIKLAARRGVGASIVAEILQIIIS